MASTIEDKISLFTKVIIERIELDFQKKQKTLTENHENRLKNIIEDYEEKKKHTIEKITKESQRKKQHTILKTRSNMRLALLKKRKELIARVFKELKKQVGTLILTDRCDEFLVMAIKKVMVRFSDEQFIFFKFSKNDIEKRKELILNTVNSFREDGSYQLDIDDDLIGGVFVRSGDGRIEADFTVNTILEESHHLIGEVLFSWLDSDKEI